MIIEQIGSAMFHPKNRINSEEIITPTLPLIFQQQKNLTTKNIKHTNAKKGNKNYQGYQQECEEKCPRKFYSHHFQFFHANDHDLFHVNDHGDRHRFRENDRDLSHHVSVRVTIYRHENDHVNHHHAEKRIYRRDLQQSLILIRQTGAHGGFQVVQTFSKVKNYNLNITR